jgi:hypothetical protein
MNLFHAGGAAAYQTAMRAEYNLQRQELEKRLREAAAEHERSRLAKELRELKANFRAQSAHWGCLF